MTRSPGARDLVLSFFAAASGSAMEVASLVRGTSFLGLTANATRVALSRLVADGRVESDERGRYRLGRRSRPADRTLPMWRRWDRLTRPWSGAWLLAAGPAVALQSQGTGRALELLALRRTREGLWVRPDNLVYSPQEVGGRLRELGAAAGLRVFMLTPADVAGTRRAWVALWRPGALAREYDRLGRLLEQSRARLPRLPERRALYETFHVGRQCTAALARDPLLPAELTPPDPRIALEQAFTAYDGIGKRLWARALPELRLVPGERLEGEAA